ncbi:carbohydrate ABC transporter permease [Clostridium thermarum]|uniref:carbohydrate ABC transporter permease n=1 Tax=Clostridium thermarum TaxID=1716543 RepID=UPI00193F4A93|nr:carbohydrate ABC transporter permease [Clostridium thermarum]
MKLAIGSRKTKGETIFDIVNVIVMAIICFLTLYPIWFTIVNSFNNGTDAMRGGIYWWPRMFSLENYKTVFASSGIMSAFATTVAKTVIGTVVHVFFTAMVAYAFSRQDLVGRKFYMTLGIITMFFGGGLIPTFLLIKSLGLLNNFLVYIIPAAFAIFDLLIFVSFFREIPAGLEEAAKIDGASDFQIFTKVILKVSLPVLATIALFHGVYQWNDYFTGVIYMQRKQNMQPIQTYLYRIVAASGANQMANGAASGIVGRTTTAESVKLATMVITTAPIVCVYPFLQKYFVKGMLLGAVKG